MKITNRATLAILATTTLLSACMNLSADNDESSQPQGETKTMTAQHPGEKVYQSACMSCHVADGKPTVAPPIFAVKNHVIGKYAERDAFIERVKNWVKAPDANDVLMPGAVKKFGLMPAMPALAEADLQAVAEYLYDTDMSMPDWYKEHYEAEHGKQPE